MHKKKGRRGRPKVRCSPRGGGLQQILAAAATAAAGDGPDRQVDPELSDKRRAAAEKRWDAARTRQLELAPGFECEIVSQEDYSDDEESLEYVEEEENVGAEEIEVRGDTQLNLSRVTLWRYWTSFQEYIPSELDLQAAVLRATQSELSLPCLRLDKKPNLTNDLPVHRSTFFRIKKKIVEYISTFQKNVASYLLLKWAQTIAMKDFHLLDSLGIFFATEEDIPKECLAQLLCDQILARMRSDLKTKVMKSFNAKLVIEVAEGLVRHASDHGDAANLARVTGVSHKFATKVIEAVKAGEQEKLFSRERRRDSIIGSGILQRFRDFISQPEQSRECPGTTIREASPKKQEFWHNFPKRLYPPCPPAIVTPPLALRNTEDLKLGN